MTSALTRRCRREFSYRSFLSSRAATADSAGNIVYYTSITIGADELGLISYYDASNQDLKVLHRGNAACSSGNTYTYLPVAGGPLIDAGDNVDCPTFDQRLNPRPLDGDTNGSSTCDIGAVEYGTPPKKVYLPLVLKNS